MTDLARKECTACRRGTPPIAPDRARELAAQLPAWSVTMAPPRVARAFVFKDFLEAMSFVNRVAEVAEAAGHHPDIHIHWNRVEIVLWTHIIDNLTENDFIVAARIDVLRP